LRFARGRQRHAVSGDGRRVAMGSRRGKVAVASTRKSEDKWHEAPRFWAGRKQAQTWEGERPREPKCLHQSP
jgi:hypothetical protein